MNRWSSRLLQLGFVRNVRATTHLVLFVVAAVSTVLITRMFLALTGYPQIGGGGLHIAHVLFGGILMLVAMFLLLSYIGPVVRPIAAFVGGIGFGLFIDELGKFITSDNDYFFRPSLAIIYVIFIATVFAIQALHTRLFTDTREYLANAVDQAVEGVAGGFTAHRRAEANELVRTAQQDASHLVHAGGEVKALVDACPADDVEVPPVADRVRTMARGLFDALAVRKWTGRVIVIVLLLNAVSAIVFSALSSEGSGFWHVLALVALIGSAAFGVVLTFLGARRLVRDRERAFRRLQLAILAYLLVTHVFEFAYSQLSAAIGLLVDLVLLGVTGAELHRLRREADA